MAKNSTKPQKKTAATGPGRGNFSAIPLTFTGVDGQSYQWGGRGRYSEPLARVIVRDSKIPVHDNAGWTWRDAVRDTDPEKDEMTSSIKLVNKLDKALEDFNAKAKERAEKRAARIAAAAELKASKKTARAAKKVKEAQEAPAPAATEQ